MQKPPLVRRQLAADRTMMANERTFLAHVRTSLHIIIAGLTLIKLFEGSVFMYLGWLLLPAGLYILVRGYMARDRITFDLQKIKDFKTVVNVDINNSEEEPAVVRSAVVLAPTSS